MAMEEDLVARLVADAGVSALVGEAVSWGDRVRGDPLPAVTIIMVSPGRDYDHGGPNGEDEPRLQFDCWGLTAVDAAAVKRALTTCMEQPATVGDTKFEEGFLEGERWIDEGEQDGGDPLFRISQDYVFLHSPA